MHGLPPLLGPVHMKCSYIHVYILQTYVCSTNHYNAISNFWCSLNLLHSLVAQDYYIHTYMYINSY